MKKIIFVAIAAAFILLPCAAFADNPNDSAVGTRITAEAYQLIMRYSDSGGSTKSPVYGTTIEVVVVAEYGFDYLADLPGGATEISYTTPTTPVLYTYLATNEGNATDAYMIRYYYSVGGTAMTGEGWNVKVTEEGYSTVYLSRESFSTAGVTAWATINAIAEDSNRRFTVTVTPSPNQWQSPDGGFINITLEVYTTAEPSGFYYGANGLTYGGTDESKDLTVTCIQTAVMKMTRVATVDAPTTVAGKFSGDAHAAVPGAIITYTIMTSNEGSTTARSLEVVDKVPANTLAAHIGCTGTAASPNVSITAADDNAPLWTAYYSTGAPDTTTYGNIGTPPNNWITVGATPANKSLTIEAGTGATSLVTYVKWEKLYVTTTEDAKTLTWGVTIR